MLRVTLELLVQATGAEMAESLVHRASGVGRDRKVTTTVGAAHEDGTGHDAGFVGHRSALAFADEAEAGVPVLHQEMVDGVRVQGEGDSARFTLPCHRLERLAVPLDGMEDVELDLPNAAKVALDALEKLRETVAAIAADAGIDHGEPQIRIHLGVTGEDQRQISFVGSEQIAVGIVRVGEGLERNLSVQHRIEELAGLHPAAHGHKEAAGIELRECGRDIHEAIRVAVERLELEGPEVVGSRLLVENVFHEPVGRLKGDAVESVDFVGGRRRDVEENDRRGLDRWDCLRDWARSQGMRAHTECPRGIAEKCGRIRGHGR